MRRKDHASKIELKRFESLEVNKLGKDQVKEDLRLQKKREETRQQHVLEHLKMQKLKDLIHHNKAKEYYAVQQDVKKISAMSKYSLKQEKVEKDLMLHKSRIK